MDNKLKFIFVAGVTVALVAGFWFGQVYYDQQQIDSLPGSHVMLLEKPRKLAIPALQQDNGGTFDIESIQGKWSLMFFGFTHCPDVCPATLNTLAQAKKEYSSQVAEASDTKFPQVVFISVDPQRDNVKVLGEYVRYFDKDFIGATGEEKLLRAIAVQTNSTFHTQPSENPNAYQVGHSLNVVLINPAAEVVAVLGPPHTVKSILDVLRHFQIMK